MKPHLVTAAFAATLFSAGVFAQAPQSSPPVATPTPAPVVSQPAVAAPAPSQHVYVPRLPTAQELTNAAAAQGRTVERIEESNGLITLVTRDASGRLNTVIYQLLPPVGGTTMPVPATVATSQPTTVVTTPPPTVVYYETAPRVVYYDDFYYGPRFYPWYPPVSVHLGFGYYRGFGGYRGGFHHR